MSKIIIEIEAQALVPTLQVFQEYFDSKYPCTDETNNELERCMQPINVKHLTRYKHTFGDYTTYSFNTHYTNGLFFYGMIPDPPFPLNIKKDKI